MDELFDNIGSTMVELETNPPAPRPKPVAVRVREFRQRQKDRIAYLEGKISGGNQTPLEYMLSVINDPTAPNQRRDRMAIEAAKYFHQVPKEEKLGVKDKQAIAAEEAATGTYAPQEAPVKLVYDSKAKQ